MSDNLISKRHDNHCGIIANKNPIKNAKKMSKKKSQCSFWTILNINVSMLGGYHFFSQHACLDQYLGKQQ
jgi:hypothetical protein